MLTLLETQENSLYIKFRNEFKNKMSVLFIWEESLNNSLIFSDLVEIKPNYVYFSQVNKNLNFFKNDIIFKVVSLETYEILFKHTFSNFFISGKEVYYISSNDTTGYSVCARNYIYQLLNENYNVFWNAKDFFNDTYELSPIEEKIEKCKIINKNKKIYENLIIHSTPDVWQKTIEKLESEKIIFNKIYGLTTWETTKLSKKWIDSINNSKVDEIIVQSKFNSEIFEKDIHKKIHIWYPDIFLFEEKEKIELENINNKLVLYSKQNFFINDENLIQNILDKNTVYYNISQYSERKNLDQLIKVFCKKFNKNDKVCLFIKTYFKDFVNSQTEYLKYKFYKLLENLNDIPPIIFCFEKLTENQIQKIHMIGDVYFTLNRGEGFGMCTYTAKKLGNKIITGKFGAEKEFLDSEDVLIDYKLVNTFNMYHFHNYYDDNEQKWAAYNDSDILEKLKYIPKKNPAQGGV